MENILPYIRMLARQHRAPLVVVGVLSNALFGVGCSVTESEPVTHCDSARNQYIDFRTSHCTTPTTKEETVILAMHERLVRIAEREPDTIVDYQVSFARHMGPDEFAKFIQDDAIISVKNVFLRLTNVDPPITAAEPVPVDIPKHEAVTWSFKHLQTMMAREPELVEQIQASAAARAYDIAGMRMRLRAAEASRWWKQHLDSVRLIQPKMNAVDETLPPWEPGEAVQ